VSHPPSLLHVILVSLLAHLALAGARVTTSLFALSLHASAFTVGTLIAVFALFPMLLALRTGRLVDRLGITTPMAAGSAAMVLGCVLAAWAGTLEWLYLAAALIGTGFMAIQVSAQHCVGAISATDQRGANFSRLSLGFSISGFCGPVFAGLLIDNLRYGAAYLAFGICATGALLLVRTMRPRGKAPPATSDTSAASAAANPAVTATAFDLLRTPLLRHIYATGILLAAAWDLFTFVLPIHGARIGYSASTIGFILGCFSAATFAVRIVMPWLMRRFGEWQLLFGALILAALCYASFPLLHTPAALMAVAAALGLAVGASQPNMLALLHHAAPAGRAGEALGIRITMGNACQVVLPLAFGGAGAALGLGVVFWAMAALIASGVPLAWQHLRRH
jgi:MFS family permease